MKKIGIFLGLFAVAFAANAAVNLDVSPASLVTTETELEAESEVAVFEFALNATGSETLDSVHVTVESTSATSDDLAEVSVYKDDGNEDFDSSDTQIGLNSTVNIGSETIIDITGDNTLDGTRMFVVLMSSSTWSEDDSVTITLNTNGVVTSENIPTVTESTTAEIIFPAPTPTPTITPTPSPTPTPTDEFGTVCTSGIINGKLYKVGEEPTVYLAAACKLKPFRGAAVFHARGHKFQNIITLASLTGIEVSTKPALPAGGTLVKGSADTVWFVTEDGKKKGFTSSQAFTRLGFNFGSVKPIADTDLNELTTDENVTEQTSHPEGAVVKCTTSATVYMVKGNKKFAFTNPQPYLDRGHTWDAIAVVDCQTFNYEQGANITQ